MKILGKTLLLVFSLFALLGNTNAQITFLPDQVFRIYSASPVVDVELNFSAVAPSGTVTSVVANIDGTDYAATLVSGEHYSISWSTNVFGTFPVIGTMTTSTGMTESTFLINLKIIQLTECPVAPWNAATAYNGGDYTAYQNTLYIANYWTQGNTPGADNAWIEQGVCSSQNYPTMNCTDIENWDSETIYGPDNIDIDVQYNGTVYRAAYWTQNNTPDLGGPWQFVSVCATLNELPSVQSDFLNAVVDLAQLSITADITDSDGIISDVLISIDDNVLTPVSASGDTYSVSWTPPALGIYNLEIIATDDELGATSHTGTIQVASSAPPVIAEIMPFDGQDIKNVYQLNSDILTRSADATAPDGTIANVTFTIDGQTYGFSSNSGDNYSYGWVPGSYGSYTLLVEATDNSGSISRESTTFTLTDPYYEAIDTINIPLQIQANLGYDKNFDFGEPLSEVIVRNQALLTATIAGNEMLVNANRTGRTGLKITTLSGKVYYIGIRINDCDGTIPGMPDYASIGFKSEDTTPNLAFWEDVDIDLTNKNMDVRYIYINGGPIISGTYNSWRTPERTLKFCRNSLKYGLIPFFVYYNIPDGGESFETDLMHARDVNYMTEYFQDLNNFIDDCTSVMGDDLFGILLEPDFLGYMQQLEPSIPW